MLAPAFALLLGATVAPATEPALRQAAELVRAHHRLLQENGPHYVASVTPLWRALEIYRKAGARGEIADTLRRILRLDPHAVPVYAAELAALDRHLGAPRSILAEDELFLAQHFYQERRFDRAFAHLEAAKRRAAEENDVRLLAKCHTVGGNIRDFQGESDQAIAEWREADRLYGLTGDSLRQAHARSNLGRWLLESGEYAEALRVLESALALSESIEHSLQYHDDRVLNREAMGEALGALAEINRRLGRPEQALALFDRSRNKFRWALSPGQAYMHMIDMADIYSEMGRDREAERFYELVLLASPAHPSGTEAFQPLKVRVGYARHLLRTRRPAEARELLTEGLAIALRHRCYGFAAECMLELGAVEMRLGNAGAAGRWFDRALGLARSHVSTPEVLWRAHHGRGRALAAAGKSDLAAAEYQRAINAIEQWLRNIPESAESPASTETSVWAPYHDLLIEELRLRATDRALRLAEQAKMALVTLAVPKHDPPEVLSAAERREDERFRKRLAQLRSFALVREESGASNVDLLQLVNEYSLFRQTLFRRHPELQSDRAALEPVGAVEGVRLARASGATILNYVLAGESAFVFVIDANGARALDLPAGAKHIRELASELAATQQDPFRASRSAPYSPAARGLYRALIPPSVEASLERASALAIVPDAELWLVPFEMLWRSHGGRKEYLVERFPISYAPSMTVMRVLLQRSERRRRERARPLRVAAVLDPVLSESELRPYLSARATLFEGTRATRAAARFALERMDVVHFGCHGIYNEKFPLYSALLLSHEPSSADGFLEARDIAGIRIGAQLVTFAACDSGRGEVVRGQGLLGMTWAALRGGAASAVAMRWAVDEHATARLFDSFYRNLDRGEQQDDALRSAQLELIRSPGMANPYFWAGVTLIGCERRR